jgi:hypothetical protein
MGRYGKVEGRREGRGEEGRIEMKGRGGMKGRWQDYDYGVYLRGQVPFTLLTSSSTSCS